MVIKQTPFWLLCSKRTMPVSTIVLHHDAGASDDSGLQYLINLARAYVPNTKRKAASYHYYVGRDGTVTKCVPLSKKAWHCGVSHGPKGANVNDYSIGIALANRGDGEEYPEVQLQAALALVKEISKAIVGVKHLTTHRLCCEPNGRKIDPAFFDFIDFGAKTELEMWRSKGRTWNG